MAVDTNGPPLHNLWHTTIFGQPAIQYWSDLWLWEKLLNDRADTGHPLRCIIELGSGTGGLTLFLLTQSLARTMQFWTFDRFVTPAATTPLGVRLGLPDRCVAGDMWSTDVRNKIASILSDSGLHPLALLCDGGNKPREFATFMPMLSHGDVILVHDFHNEFDLPDIPTPLLPRLEMLRQADCEQMQLLTRAWLVK